MPTKTCAYAGCPRTVKARGLCNGHYQQVRQGRPLLPVRECAGRPVRQCAREDCERSIEDGGEFCRTHNAQLARTGALTAIRDYGTVECTFPECGRPHDSRGYCVTHARQLRQGVTLTPIHENVGIPQSDGTVQVELRGRGGKVTGYTRVDAADWARMKPFRWCLTGGYAAAKLPSGACKLHRFLLDAPPDLQVDHIDGNGLNNRRDNLRLVSYPQQMQNKKSWGVSGHRGVTWDERKRLWRAMVTLDGKRYSGGRHKKLEDAITAVKALRARLHSHANEARHPYPGRDEGAQGRAGCSSAVD